MFFGEDLDKHDDEEDEPDKERLPSPEPDNETGEVREGAGEHRIAVETIGTVGHQMLRARTDLLAESVHRIALAMGFHINDSPHAEAQASEDEDAGYRRSECADMHCQVRRTGHEPHEGGK